MGSCIMYFSAWGQGSWLDSLTGASFMWSGIGSVLSSCGQVTMSHGVLGASEYIRYVGMVVVVKFLFNNTLVDYFIVCSRSVFRIGVASLFLLLWFLLLSIFFGGCVWRRSMLCVGL